MKAAVVHEPAALLVWPYVEASCHDDGDMSRTGIAHRP